MSLKKNIFNAYFGVQQFRYFAIAVLVAIIITTLVITNKTLITSTDNFINANSPSGTSPGQLAIDNMLASQNQLTIADILNNSR
jgi:hypothetical protein